MTERLNKKLKSTINDSTLLFSTQFENKIVNMHIPKGMIVIVIGDIHGSYEIVEKIKLMLENPSYQNVFFVLLGDILDRGKHSLLCLYTILTLFNKYPDRVLILKGNHEHEHSKYKSCYDLTLSDELFKAYSYMVDEMPVSCILTIGETKYFLSHASFPSVDMDYNKITCLQNILDYNAIFYAKSAAKSKFSICKSKLIDGLHNFNENKDDTTLNEAEVIINTKIDMISKYSEIAEILNGSKIKECYNIFVHEIEKKLTEELENKTIAKIWSSIMADTYYYNISSLEQVFQIPTNIYEFQIKSFNDVINTVYKRLLSMIKELKNDPSFYYDDTNVIPSDTLSFMLYDIDFHLEKKFSDDNEIKKIVNGIESKYYIYSYLSKLVNFKFEFKEAENKIEEAKNNIKQISMRFIDDLKSDDEYSQNDIEKVIQIMNSHENICPEIWSKLFENCMTLNKMREYIASNNSMIEEIKNECECYSSLRSSIKEYIEYKTELVKKMFECDKIVSNAVWHDVIIEGTEFKPTYRGEEYGYGENYTNFAELMERCGINCFIRGHQPLPNGLYGFDCVSNTVMFPTSGEISYKINKNSCCYITLHSTNEYNGIPPRALRITDNKVESMSF